MKTLILETSDTSDSSYQLYAEIIDCSAPTNMKQLAFSSVWSGSKHVKEHQTKCNFMLDDAAISKLKDLLNNKLSPNLL
jgi:hypothetical protein